MKDQLSFTIDATNVLVLNETADMLKRIANAQCPTMVLQNPAPLDTVSEDDVFTPSEATLELDSAGMPWDERIHASTKTKVKDGTWTFRRNLDESVKQSVLNEYGEQVAPITIAEWDEADDMIAEPEADVATIMDPPPAPEPIAVPTPPAPTQASTINSFLELMPAIRAKGVSQADTLAGCQALGLPNLISFNIPVNQHLIPELAIILGL